MSKTNFTKVEKALDEGIVKMKSQHLLQEADALKGIEAMPPKETCAAFLNQLQSDLQKVQSEDAASYEKLAFHQVDLAKLIANPSLLTPQDWKTVKEIKERLDQYKKELALRLPHESDQEIVDHEREKHLNKRFNVSKRWLPLDRLPQ